MRDNAAWEKNIGSPNFMNWINSEVDFSDRKNLKNFFMSCAMEGGYFIMVVKLRIKEKLLDKITDPIG